jgi:CheY-like chemotaxis protein
MNGFQLAERVTARFPGIRTLLMSGYAGNETRAIGRDRAILRKPFTETDLAAAVRDALDAASDLPVAPAQRRETGSGRA